MNIQSPKFNLPLEANIEFKEEGKDWSPAQKFKHWALGGEHVEVHEQKAYVYRYDGIGKRLLGVTLGVATRTLGAFARGVGVPLKPSDLNPLASKDWKELANDREQILKELKADQLDGEVVTREENPTLFQKAVHILSGDVRIKDGFVKKYDNVARRLASFLTRGLTFGVWDPYTSKNWKKLNEEINKRLFTVEVPTVEVPLLTGETSVVGNLVEGKTAVGHDSTASGSNSPKRATPLQKAFLKHEVIIFNSKLQESAAAAAAGRSSPPGKETSDRLQELATRVRLAFNSDEIKNDSNLKKLIEEAAAKGEGSVESTSKDASIFSKVGQGVFTVGSAVLTAFGLSEISSRVFSIENLEIINQKLSSFAGLGLSIPKAIAEAGTLSLSASEKNGQVAVNDLEKAIKANPNLAGEIAQDIQNATNVQDENGIFGELQNGVGELVKTITQKVSAEQAQGLALFAITAAAFMGAQALNKWMSNKGNTTET